MIDRAIQHAVDLQRYTNGVVGRVLAVLRKSDIRLFAALSEALENRPESFTAERLESLLRSVWAIDVQAFDKVGALLRTELRDFVESEALYQHRMLSSILAASPAPVAVVTSMAAAEQVFTAAYAQPFRISKGGAVTMAQYLAGLSADRARTIRNAVALGWMEGRTTSQIVRDLRGTRAQNYQDGLMAGSYRHIEGMVRTATNHMANVTAQRSYAANPDIVKGWRFMATLDGRTSITCASLDQKVFPVGKGPIPPLHGNCRSFSTVELVSWAEMGVEKMDRGPGQRASVDGPVKADTTFNDWLRGKSAAFQDEVLGATRGRLYREGKLPVSAFTNDKGKVYTLDELRKRNAALFAKTGL